MFTCISDQIKTNKLFYEKVKCLTMTVYFSVTLLKISEWLLSEKTVNFTLEILASLTSTFSVKSDR